MDGWLDATTSCTKFVDLLYTFLDYFHSDAGTLGVLFDMMKSQPPTCKVHFQQQLNELTNNSPMMDIVYEEINDLDYIKTLLDCILMYCSNLFYMTTSICIQTKIANPQFEEELYRELWLLMEKYRIEKRDHLNVKHDEYVKKWSMSCKTPVQRIETLRSTVGDEVNKLLVDNELDEEQANEITKFIQLQQNEKQELLVKELSKLTFMEKPIIFQAGKSITMKADDFISRIHRLLYLDEQKIHWMMNIHFAESFLNQTLLQLRKTIQFRYRWKDKELWFEWLKNQYTTQSTKIVLPIKVVPLKIEIQPKLKTETNNVNVLRNEDVIIKNELENKNEWIHCNTLNWLKRKNNQEIRLENQKEVHEQWKQPEEEGKT